jgi:hypothetical protein
MGSGKDKDHIACKVGVRGGSHKFEFGRTLGTHIHTSVRTQDLGSHPGRVEVRSGGGSAATERMGKRGVGTYRSSPFRFRKAAHVVLLQARTQRALEVLIVGREGAPS